MKKRWLPVLLLCLLALCLCAALHLPKTETVQLEGTLLQWQNDAPEVLEHRAFRMEGRVERRLMQRPQLYATLYLDGITENWSAQQVWVSFAEGNTADGNTVWWGNLQVYHPWNGDGEDPRKEPELLYDATAWLIRMEPDTGAFCLFCSPGLALHTTSKEAQYSLDNGRILLPWISAESVVFSFPAENREDALTLTKRLWSQPCNDLEQQWLKSQGREPVPDGWR